MRPKKTEDNSIAICAGCDCAITKNQPSRTIRVGDRIFDVHTDGHRACVAKAEEKLHISIPPLEMRVCDHATAARKRREVPRTGDAKQRVWNTKTGG